MTQLRTWVTRTAAAAVSLAPFSAMAQLVGSPNFAGTAQGDLIPSIVNIVNIFLVLAGLVAGVFLIIGGVQYIISRGDESAAEKAKNTILFAVIGLIVIGLSAAVVNFVVGAIQS